MAQGIVVQMECVSCHKKIKVRTQIESLLMFMGGISVQECFPDLLPEEREFFISGLCPKCFPAEHPVEMSEEDERRETDELCLN